MISHSELQRSFSLRCTLHYDLLTTIISPSLSVAAGGLTPPLANCIAQNCDQPRFGRTLAKCSRYSISARQCLIISAIGRLKWSHWPERCTASKSRRGTASSLFATATETKSSVRNAVMKAFEKTTGAEESTEPAVVVPSIESRPS